MSDLNATATPGYTFSATNGGDSDASADFSPLYPHHSLSIAKELIDTAYALVHPRGKGIYATDETPEGIEARLVAAAAVSGQADKIWTDEEKRERRRRWRTCLYESIPSGKVKSPHSHTIQLCEQKKTLVVRFKSTSPESFCTLRRLSTFNSPRC
jgi:hypothetical protein